MKFLLVEVVCIMLIAFGFALWVAPGAGLVAAGFLGLVLVTVAQLPTREVE